MAIDISNFYIQNDLEDYQYIRFAINMIPQDIIDEYNLEAIVHEDSYCYVEIRKVMYGLHKEAYVASAKLKRVLGLEGYVLSKFTLGLFTHKTRGIAFLLVVDDFGVRYTKRKDVKHLLKTIQDSYSVKTDQDSIFYLGVTLEFDYEGWTCKMLMPGYVKQVLIKLYHEFSKTTHLSLPFNTLVYGQKIQMATINKINPINPITIA